MFFVNNSTSQLPESYIIQDTVLIPIICNVTEWLCERFNAMVKWKKKKKTHCDNTRNNSGH